MFKGVSDKYAIKSKEIESHLTIEEEIRIRASENEFLLKTPSPQEVDSALREFKPSFVDTTIIHCREDLVKNQKLVVEHRGCSIYLSGLELMRSDRDISFISFDLSKLRNSTYRAFEIATSSITDEVASSAPSMIIHQMASIIFILVSDQKTSFEQTMGNYTSDICLLDEQGNPKFLFDTCANLDNKETEIRRKRIQNYVLLNKYAIVFPYDEQISSVLRFSKDCDSKTYQLLYETVLKQSHGLDMLYTKSTIDFLSRSRKTSNNEEDIVCLRNMIKDVMLSRNRVSLSQMSELKSRATMDPNISRLRLLEGMSSVNSSYEAISFSDIGLITNISDSYGLSKVEEEQLKTGFYFIKIHHVRVESLFKDAVRRDTEQIAQKDLRELYASQSILRMFDENLGPSRIHRTYVRAVTRRSGLFESKEDRKLKPKERFLALERFCRGTIAVPTYRIRKTEFMNTDVQIDPYHLKVMKETSTDGELGRLFSRSREYNDLRMRERVSRALYSARKPDSKILVTHWLNPRIHAECYIRGLLFEKDKGIAVVSFFDNDELMKTEKWHLSDVESYNKAPDTLVSSMVGLLLKAREVGHKIETETLIQIYRLYSKLLTENSWGTGGFMKPFRYWTSGLCMNSEGLNKTTEKLIKSISNSNNTKFSIQLIKAYLTQKTVSFGKTALFDFPFSMIGFECFLVNMTPSKTYGSKRHLRGCITELMSEIDLSSIHYEEIKGLVSHFESIIQPGNFTSDGKRRLRALIDLHLDKMDSLSLRTSGRFTLSPLSIVMISEEIDKIPRSLFQKTVPHISEIMTTKGSWDSVTSESKMALETISMLMGITDRYSTLSLAYEILSSVNPADLYMRMFDKDQVAANREISILSSQFRVLQSIAEQFARNIGRETGHDMLDNQRKISILSDNFENTVKHENRVLVTMDQTRWGPNFNTALFGWMHLYLLRRTTEAYLPALICLMSEFKVFGAPEELFEIYVKSDTIYSNPGRIGRFHMAQGIFHYTSSMYHSLVNSYQLSIMNLLFKDTHPDIPYTLNSSHLVTSDDAAIMLYLSTKAESSLKRGVAIKDTYMSDVVDNMKLMVKILMNSYKYHCILTSDYKNIISESEVEFNSFYLSTSGLGSNDLKYLNSLILNQTSGSFWMDFQNSISSYGDALNSGCAVGPAQLITQMNINRVAKMWRITVPMHGIDPSFYERGFPRFSDPADLSVKFGDDSRLHFKRRAGVLESMIDSTSIITEIVNEKLGKISSSKKSENYRTLFVPHLTEESKKLLIQNPDYPADQIYITMESCFRVSLEDRDNIYFFHDKKSQKPYSEYVMEADYPEGRNFVMHTYMQSTENEVSLKEVLVSSYKRVDSLSKLSSNDEIILHMMRKWHRLDLAPTTEELTDLYVKLNLDNERRLKGSVRQLIFRPDNSRTYKTLCYNKYMEEEDKRYIPRLTIRTNPDLMLFTNEQTIRTNYLNYFGTVSITSHGLNQRMIESGFLESSAPFSYVTLDVDLTEQDFTRTILDMLDVESLGPSYLCVLSDRDLLEEDTDYNMDEELTSEALLQRLAEIDLPDDEDQIENSGKKRIYSCKTEVNGISLLGRVWCRNMILYNKLLEILSETEVVKVLSNDSYSVSATSLFLKRARVITSDPEFSKNVTSYCERAKTLLKHKYRDSQKDWIETAFWSMGSGELKQSCLFNFNPDIYFSDRVEGIEVDNPTMTAILTEFE